MEKPIEKIKRLLRLSQSPNEHEAAAAAAAAQRLMERHRIESAALEEEPSDVLDSVTVGAPVEQSTRMPEWKIKLAAGVAQTNRCDMLIVGQFGVSHLRIVGLPEDIEGVHVLYKWLVSQIERIARSASRGKGRQYGTSFRLGAVAMIRTRLRDAAATERDSTQDRSSVERSLVKTDVIKTHIADMFRRLGASTHERSVRVQPSAFRDGAIAAKSIPLTETKRIKEKSHE